MKAPQSPWTWEGRDGIFTKHTHIEVTWRLRSVCVHASVCVCVCVCVCVSVCVCACICDVCPCGNVKVGKTHLCDVCTFSFSCKRHLSQYRVPVNMQRMFTCTSYKEQAKTEHR